MYDPVFITTGVVKDPSTAPELVIVVSAFVVIDVPEIMPPLPIISPSAKISPVQKMLPSTFTFPVILAAYSAVASFTRRFLIVEEVVTVMLFAPMFPPAVTFVLN
jgi:hypothetical protein